jgi:hypothetical protein
MMKSERMEKNNESRKEMGGNQEQMGCLGIIRCAYVEMDKPLLAKIMNHKLPQLLGISKWGQNRACSKKLDNNDEL